MRAFTNEWLKAATDDLLIISDIIHRDTLTHMVAFHSQQAIEKVLKALLEEYEIDTPKIHKLIKLNTILLENNKFEQLDKELLNSLDELYIDSRYPGEMGLLPYGKPTLKDAKRFYEFAQEIFNKVCKILNISIKELNNEN